MSIQKCGAFLVIYRVPPSVAARATSVSIQNAWHFGHLPGAAVRGGKSDIHVDPKMRGIFGHLLAGRHPWRPRATSMSIQKCGAFLVICRVAGYFAGIRV
ncbi:MAG: hypothetical protein LBI67_11475 [Treponema sp.]|nr:hypothetical protein [Treponema sp.]